MLDDLEHVTNIELALTASKSKKILEEMSQIYHQIAREKGENFLRRILLVLLFSILTCHYFTDLLWFKLSANN